ncbi:hypothetical protein [Saccharothrix syringae]|uniref:Restriction endonuclease type IV Mrr domain-containing protein n=1 Tax=Saccharothrix syringae TaxID=103733 RepID=A0A5Q0H3E4_SACSY|nr:hypothetical protein [Saccharothrix syringae]QFZ20603.1 hypothetical protein EKG83_27200 [Saccharothrix syringae]
MRCLLATTLDAPRERLRQVMDRLNIDLVEAERLEIDWLTHPPRLAVDFICAVLRKSNDQDAEAAIFVDIGVALGRQIPVFLIVEPRREVPLVVAGLTRVEADLDNEEALSLHLGQFIRALHRGRTDSSTEVRRRRVLSQSEAEIAHARLRELQSIDERNIGSKVERFVRLVTDLLDTGDVEVSAVRMFEDRGYDMALWSNDVSPTLGGPIPIQLKLWSQDRPNAVRKAAEVFARQLSERPFPFGILIYDAPGENTSTGPRQPSPARIVTISAHQLIDKLTEQSLTEVLTSMRNAVMHGASYGG